MEGGFADEKVEERGVVGLNHEEKDFFGRYSEKGRANYCIGWVGPYPTANEVRIPRGSRYNCNLGPSKLTMPVFESGADILRPKTGPYRYRSWCTVDSNKQSTTQLAEGYNRDGYQYVSPLRHTGTFNDIHQGIIPTHCFELKRQCILSKAYS